MAKPTKTHSEISLNDDRFSIDKGKPTRVLKNLNRFYFFKTHTHQKEKKVLKKS